MWGRIWLSLRPVAVSGMRLRFQWRRRAAFFLQAPVRSHTHTAVRKDTIDLFGFLDQEEFSAFLLLLSVSGVGPKKALAVLDAMPVSTLLSAIQREDVDTLVSFGVGKKQAQRMVLDLQKKIELDGAESGISGDVVFALVALGYDKKRNCRGAEGGCVFRFNCR